MMLQVIQEEEKKESRTKSLNYIFDTVIFVIKKIE